MNEFAPTYMYLNPTLFLGFFFFFFFFFCVCSFGESAAATKMRAFHYYTVSFILIIRLLRVGVLHGCRDHIGHRTILKIMNLLIFFYLWFFV